MAVVQENGRLNTVNLKQLLVNEYTYIQNIFSSSLIPDRKEVDYEDVLLDGNDKSTQRPSLQKKHTSRATSFQELHTRLDKLKGKRKIMYKERLEKKKIKNKLKKKTKRDERNAKIKLERAQKTNAEDNTETTKAIKEESAEEKKPVFNKEDKLVYSKINFDEIGKRRKLKVEKDPKKLLKKLEKQKEIVERLKDSGEIKKAVEIKEKSAWKNALAKAEGQKVKDDPQLLMKSLKKKEQKKRASQKKWEKRIEGVKKALDERQLKRSENIQKRKKDKKTNKLKKAAKKGKIIPGF